MTDDTTSLPAGDGTPDHRGVIEAMVTEQPCRLQNRMLAAVRDRALSEDLAQETLTRALRSVATVRGPAEEALVCGWLEAIAANVVRAHARAAGRRPRLVELEAVSEQRSGDGSDPAEVAAASDTLARLGDLVAGLDPDLAEVFAARVLDERPTAEVAAELGISPELVRWRLRRARMLLRRSLDATA